MRDVFLGGKLSLLPFGLVPMICIMGDNIIQQLTWPKFDTIDGSPFPPLSLSLYNSYKRKNFMDIIQTSTSNLLSPNINHQSIRYVPAKVNFSTVCKYEDKQHYSVIRTHCARAHPRTHCSIFLNTNVVLASNKVGKQIGKILNII